MGRKKRPIYAVVAADVRSPRDGRYIEDIGRYEPLNEPAVVTLRDDRALYWLEQGAQPTDTVRSLPWVRGVNAANGSWEVSLDEDADTATAMRELVTAVPVARVELRRPTLEDVFVQLVAGDGTADGDEEARLRASLRAGAREVQ